MQKNESQRNICTSSLSSSRKSSQEY